jgi:hypothetical protein
MLSCAAEFCLYDSNLDIFVNNIIASLGKKKVMIRGAPGGIGNGDTAQKTEDDSIARGIR